MVERRNNFQRLGKQHAIAENVARHITDTRNRDGFLLDINAHFGKMALHR